LMAKVIRLPRADNELNRHVLESSLQYRYRNRSFTIRAAGSPGGFAGLSSLIGLQGWS
jgi:hypothetical protein